MLLTKSSTFIIGWISSLLGYVMEGIFFVLDKIGIPFIGLAIIIFTLVIYIILSPLTYRQQKFSKLQAKMAPELNAINEKYKGKNDNDSMMARNTETQAVYAKYGVSPTGSCLQLVIQLPILWSLYHVIYSMPAYVAKIKEAFFPLVDNLIAQEGSADFISKFTNATQFTKQFTNESFTSGVTEYVQNTYIDVLNRASTDDWMSIASKYPSLASDVDNSLSLLHKYNSFFGLNISDSPWYTVQSAFSQHNYLIIVAAVMIPVLAALSQWFNTKLIPQAASSGNSQADQMAQQMKTMNMIMPLISAWFTFTLPAGMGIYWIAGAVIRSIIQIIMNKRIDKMDFDAIIEKNKEKAAAKMEKAGITNARLREYASVNTKKISNPQKYSSDTSVDNEEKVKKAYEYFKANAAEGSIASKINLVREYNEEN